MSAASGYRHVAWGVACELMKTPKHLNRLQFGHFRNWHDINPYFQSVLFSDLHNNITHASHIQSYVTYWRLFSVSWYCSVQSIEKSVFPTSVLINCVLPRTGPLCICSATSLGFTNRSHREIQCIRSASLFRGAVPRLDARSSIALQCHTACEVFIVQLQSRKTKKNLLQIMTQIVSLCSNW